MLSGPIGEEVAPPDRGPGHVVFGDLAIAPVGGAAGKTYEELYVEHAPAARRLALSMVPRDVAEDIVAEAFTRVLTAIRAGGGPGLAFRAYLLTAVRNLAHDWMRARRRTAMVSDADVDPEEHGAGQTPAISRLTSGADAQAAARAEERLVARAFAKLPVRWRAVLWQLEVEGKAPAAVAPIFGLSANGVSALAVRAREGLRQGYLQEHIGANVPAACRAYAAELGAGARGRLSRRRRTAVREHLQHCATCTELFTELTELNSRLGAIITPAVLATATAGLAAGRRTMLMRTGLAGAWHSWRLHPVTAATGAAAGLAVAGGMVFAVNVMPVITGPSHSPARPAATSTVLGPAGRGARGRASAGSGSGSFGTAAPDGKPARVTGAAAAACAGAGTPSTACHQAEQAAGDTSSSQPGSGAGATGAPGAGTGGTTAGQAPNESGTSSSPSTGPLRSALRGVAGDVGQAVANVAQAVGTALGDTTAGLGNTVGSATKGLGDTVSGATGAVGGVVGTTTGDLGSTVGSATGALGHVLGNLGKVPQP